MGVVTLVVRAILWLLGAIFSLIGSMFGIGGSSSGPRPALPRSQLPENYRGVWTGMVRDTSPNTYSQYRCVIDLETWTSKTDPTGPGHHGATGVLRLVQVEPGFIEIEEDVQSGHSIDYSVDGIFRLRMNSGGGISAEWRSQYPERDIYIGRGDFQRVPAYAV